MEKFTRQRAFFRISMLNCSRAVYCTFFSSWADIIGLFKWGGGRKDLCGSSICQGALCTGSRAFCPTCVLGSELRLVRTQKPPLKAQPSHKHFPSTMYPYRKKNLMFSCLGSLSPNNWSPLYSLPHPSSFLPSLPPMAGYSHSEETHWHFIC